MAETVSGVVFFEKVHWQVLFGAAIVCCMDALSKAYISATLKIGESLPILPGIFQLTRLKNTGAAFSMFYQHPGLLTAVSGMLLPLFALFMLTQKSLNSWERLGFMFVLGGAFSNLLDRIFLGGVTDFLDFTLIHFAVFNLADSFIFIGVVLLISQYVKHHYQATDS
jgi:signal peptidase II